MDMIWLYIEVGSVLILILALDDFDDWGCGA